MVVYFIQAGESAIKIGITENLEGRLTNLKTGNHEGLKVLHQIDCPSRETAARVEAELHRFFRDFHLKGEWFKVSPFILNGIDFFKESEYQSILNGNIYTDIYMDVFNKLNPIWNREFIPILKQYREKQNVHALRDFVLELQEMIDDIRKGHY